MMKNLIKTLGFILAVVGPSVAMAAPRTDNPQTNTTTDPNKIINTVCIESDQIPGGKKCDDAEVTIVSDVYACLSITGTSTVIPSNGKIKFTCKSSDSTKTHTFKIDCGNGHIEPGTGTASFSYTCSYEDDTIPYNVACYVDDQTNPACETTIGYGIFGECGNGIMEDGEDCDLWSNVNSVRDNPMKIYGKLDLTYNHLTHEYDGNLCRNCKIISGGNFVYEPAECLHTDTPISVMDTEVVPFWWRLWIKDTQRVGDYDSCEDYDGEKTLLLDDEDHKMKCHFAVYNGIVKQGDKPIQNFITNCYNEYYSKPIYNYFKHIHETKADGANIATANFITDNNNDKYGEYKLVLEKVEYSYCNTNTNKWEKGERYGAVCEVNFAVTRPYIMQISTFGVNPVGTNGGEFLDDFYDMEGERLLKKTDLANVIKTDGSDYAVESDVKAKFDEFKNKYGKLAVKVDENNVKIKGVSLATIFENAREIRKVPNKSIYFIKGEGTLVLEQENINSMTSAYTIIVEGMDVKIKGNVLQYAMIVTDQKMEFEDAGPEGYNGCADGGQVVQGIFVAVSGFKAIDANNRLRNIDENENRCAWGGLHVKGVLIGSGIENIMDAKRSQLNSWFNITTSNIKRERRQKIIRGAAVLIEYSPSLWKMLPPGAEIFTESLEVYRR